MDLAELVLQPTLTCLSLGSDLLSRWRGMKTARKPEGPTEEVEEATPSSHITSLLFYFKNVGTKESI